MELKNIQEPQGEIIYSLDELPKVVELLYPMIQKASVVTFTGSLGAGKTTLVQALLKKMGVNGPIQSPTYSYVNSYKLQDGFEIFHFDLYRLSSLDEFMMAGFDEDLYQPESKAVVEWPGIIMPMLQEDACHIAIDYEGLDKRKINYQLV